jgi:hypothetical protein
MSTAPYQTSSLIQALIRNDAKQYFAEHCEEIHKALVLFLEKTTLPDTTSCSDSRVVNTIKTLDDLIKCPGDQYISRLAYVQLTSILAALKERAKKDLRHGLVVGKLGKRGKRSQGSDTLAIDLHLSATGRVDRDDIHGLTRLANRWAALAGRYPLLLVIFTGAAEKIM